MWLQVVLVAKQTSMGSRYNVRLLLRGSRSIGRIPLSYAAGVVVARERIEHLGFLYVLACGVASIMTLCQALLFAFRGYSFATIGSPYVLVWRNVNRLPFHDWSR